MGLFSKSKPKVNQASTLTCVSGDASSYKCIFLASYRGVPIDVEWCESSSLDEKMSESLNMSNLNRYPCIKDGDFTVCGENAVLTFLNIKGRAPTIHPRKARVLAEQQYRIQVLLTKFTSEENYDAVFTELDKALENKKYIVGEFSLADIHWIAAFKSLEESGINIDVGEYKNINDWIARMKSEISNYETNDEEVAA